MNVGWISDAIALDENTTILQLIVQTSIVLRIHNVRVCVYDGHQKFPVTEKYARQRFQNGAFDNQQTGRTIARHVIVKHFRPNVRIVRSFVKLTEKRYRKHAGQCAR